MTDPHRPIPSTARPTASTTARTRRPTRVRRFYEWVQAVLMPLDWPARTVQALGLLPSFHVDRREIVVSPKATRSIRIAFASDFHAGPTTPTSYLHRVLADLAALEPDLILLGGDFVSIRADYVNRLAAGLTALAQTRPVYAVLGNHDYYAGGDDVADRLRQAGVQVLVNEGLRLSAPFEWVSLYGLDDHLIGRPEPPSPALAAMSVPLRVVLMHAPSGLLDIGDYRFDLALAGHIHGGQISLPGGVPLLVPEGALSRRFARGYFDLGRGRRLLVSRGVGFTNLPIRFHADPEIHLVTVRA